MFDLKKPCPDCPFRKDVKQYLRPGRMTEIMEDLESDKTFSCHKHLPRDGKKEQHCAGALLYLEAQNNPNQMMRIAERFNAYDKDALHTEIEIYASPEEFEERLLEENNG